jgi:hypothetical protein
MKKRLVISNMYRAKNKSSFFAIHQAITKFSEFDIEFHILWDDLDYRDEWSNKIDNLDCNIVSYTKEQLNQYCLEYGVAQEFIDKFVNFKAIYFILHGHYMKKNNIANYYLIYDDDIVFAEDITEFKECLLEEVPCLIHEPLNANCDKVLINTLVSLYEGADRYYMTHNPNLYGFNAGIQGISLDMYEDFLEHDYFMFMLNLFNYSGIYDENGKEITGFQRTMIDTQQQSFFGVMNIIRSKKPPHILNPSEYFVCPNWGHHPTYGYIDHENEFQGWDINMKSKVIHFIGHTVLEGVYYGKPKMYHKLVDEYLKKHNVI